MIKKIIDIIKNWELFKRILKNYPLLSLVTDHEISSLWRETDQQQLLTFLQNETGKKLILLITRRDQSLKHERLFSTESNKEFACGFVAGNWDNFSYITMLASRQSRGDVDAETYEGLRMSPDETLKRYTHNG